MSIGTYRIDVMRGRVELLEHRKTACEKALAKTSEELRQARAALTQELKEDDHEQDNQG
jgi:hypothetical protein